MFGTTLILASSNSVGLTEEGTERFPLLALEHSTYHGYDITLRSAPYSLVIYSSSQYKLRLDNSLVGRKYAQINRFHGCPSQMNVHICANWQECGVHAQAAIITVAGLVP
jgi:hypothetical protein